MKPPVRPQPATSPRIPRSPKANRWIQAKELIAAAALYDDTAAEQLTTGLFFHDNRFERQDYKDRALTVVTEALNPPHDECRWTVEQQTRLRGFIETIEGLEP